MKNLTLLLTIGAALSACSGGGGSSSPAPDLDLDPAPVAVDDVDAPADPDPLQTVAARVFDGTESDLNPTLSTEGDTVTVNLDGDEVVLSVWDLTTLPAHSVATGLNNNVTYIAGAQQTDAATAGFVSGVDIDDASVATGYVFVERLDDTLVPVTGSASFSGDYLGIVANVVAMAGDASLEADFANGAVTGSITNRRSINVITGEDNGDLTSSDMLLELTDLDGNGAFSGILSGGDLDDGEEIISGSGGIYTGLITGEAGDSAAVGLRNDYMTEFGKTFEVGSFIAD